jgi:hypothetical protein
MFKEKHMKQNKTITRGMAALALALVFASCGGGAKAVPLDKLAAYLAKLPANTDTTPATVGIANVNISAEMSAINSAVEQGNRYVILDLSSCIANGNTIRGDSFPRAADMLFIRDNKLIKGVILPKSLTSIGWQAFLWCESLASVTIPASVTRIENSAFGECKSLTSVTFETGSAITEFNSAFDGDLRDKYLAGGAGTYTRSGKTWTKR